MQFGTHAHWPAALHCVPTTEQLPHEPPQPSSPQLRVLQSGVQLLTQRPARVSQAEPAAHPPHDPPQPSSPQTLPAQLGVQMQAPWSSQLLASGHFPQDPPQPSSPQTLSAQLAVQTHAP
jgi:hypothetical protein